MVLPLLEVQMVSKGQGWRCGDHKELQLSKGLPYPKDSTGQACKHLQGASCKSVEATGAPRIGHSPR